MTIPDRLNSIRESITETAIDCGRDPSAIKLVAVSKRHSIASIGEAIKAGQHLFGENYIQEAAEKRKQIDSSAEFHFIGHVQTNKAKLAAELFTMIETVDRYKLAKVLNTQLEKLERNLNILIQVNIGRDEKKSGVEPEKAKELLEQIKPLSRLRPLGLMTIPPFTKNTEEVRNYFKKLYCLGKDLAKQKLFVDNMNIELSMGMSHDFKIAIEEGATIIRVGTAIFGARNDKT
ncbi:MAG TPA: YggS family pyridoxal phosphate-dependent enzyme [Desulfobacterales bacterium]|nr:YggS family pyridoxal phosphate-dependent enzyme [Desulfobacterales bacterium]HIP39565.1 YggS family pyridoxal phosphate-dependent enzyme [Desulfocapsa sulfexigens]